MAVFDRAAAAWCKIPTTALPAGVAAACAATVSVAVSACTAAAAAAAWCEVATNGVPAALSAAVSAVVPAAAPPPPPPAAAAWCDIPHKRHPCCCCLGFNVLHAIHEAAAESFLSVISVSKSTQRSPTNRSCC